MINPTEFLYGGGGGGHGHGHEGHGHGSAVGAPRSTEAIKIVGGHHHPVAAGPLSKYRGQGNPYHLCAHGHHEMNYRKKALGWGAYKYADPFAPFSAMLPRYHVETVYPGRWFAAGHYNLREQGLKFALSTWGCIASGATIALTQYYVRMSRNGWIIRNKGAVRGEAATD